VSGFEINLLGIEKAKRAQYEGTAEDNNTGHCTNICRNSASVKEQNVYYEK
jgi:hypothetical protein